MAQFWHTLKEDGSKYRLKFMLDKKEIFLTLDDFRTIFHLSQANDNNHDRYVPPPSFSDMVSFYKNELGFTMELKTSSSFKTTGLLQPWQTLCKIFFKCLTTRVTGWDQPPLQIMKMIYKDKVGMKIPAWMISEVMKHTEHYRMYAEVFGIDVPLTQSQPTESTQGTYRTPSAPRENVELVNEHLASVKIEKMVEGQENVIDDSSISRNDEHNILDTRLEPRSDKERPEEKGKIVEESSNTPFPTPIRSPRIYTNLVSSDTEKLQELTELQGRYGYLFEQLRARFMPRKSFATLAGHLQEVRDQVPVYVAEGLILERQKNKEKMKKMIAKAILKQRRNIQAQISLQIQKAIANDIPSQVDASLQQQDIPIWLALQMKFGILQVPQTTCRTSVVRPKYQDNPHDDAHPEGENSAKRQKTSEYEAYVSGESSSGQDNEKEQGPSTSDVLQEISIKYHIDQMKNFLKSDIIWESIKEILVSPHPRKTTPLVQSCQRDPEAPTLSLINQDRLYLKKRSSWPEKIVLSLHKFPVVIFNDDDIKEQTSRWKEPGEPKEVIYSNSKINQVFKTYWELGHEHKFIIEIVARRANECIVSITDPDFKNLNKNDTGDMYLLIMNGKVPDYAETGLLWSLSVFIRSSVIWERVHDFQLGIKSYQQKVNLTAPTISFPGIEKHEMFFIIYEPVHGIIYKNNKKEKRVMRHLEIQKFCDATLNRVLEGLKSYNNDVKYGYIQNYLTKDEAEYLKLFEEEMKYD
nr:hypothetical protein [Tanacetum cinerariifolium]